MHIDVEAAWEDIVFGERTHVLVVLDGPNGPANLVTVRRSKTNQEGETKDVPFVKDGVARALPDAAGGHDSRTRGLCGVAVAAPSSRAEGASTSDVMLAGNWKTSRTG